MVYEDTKNNVSLKINYENVFIDNFILHEIYPFGVKYLYKYQETKFQIGLGIESIETLGSKLVSTQLTEI